MQYYEPHRDMKKEITDLRIHIAQAEKIREVANSEIDKSIARYLVKRLKKRLLELVAPQPKEL